MLLLTNKLREQIKIAEKRTTTSVDPYLTYQTNKILTDYRLMAERLQSLTTHEGAFFNQSFKEGVRSVDILFDNPAGSTQKASKIPTPSHFVRTNYQSFIQVKKT